MPAGIWFWLIYILCFLFGGWFFWSQWGYYGFGGSFVIFFLMGLLGWKLFGPPIQ